jgi:site-specific DNA-methyltransferase (adenine-specific)
VTNTGAARIAVKELSTFPGNPRKGQVDAIVESLKANGQYRPIVVNAGSLTGRKLEVLAGNHTLLAADRLGWPEIDVWIVDVDDEKAKRIVATDNRSSDLGVYDDHALFELLDSLSDLAGTGYSDKDLVALSKLQDDPEPPADFPTFDEDIETDYCCPKCGYEWSGKPS